MLSVLEAQENLLAGIHTLAPIRLPLLQAIGHALAEDIEADIDNPPFNNSAVDGFAVISADTLSASEESPAHLALIDEVPAGAVSTKTLRQGECIKVMTGAPIPNGADSVVMVEDTRASGESIAVMLPASSGDHVRPAGSDVRRGQRVLCSRMPIRSPEIAMLAAMGRTEVSVIRRPRVAVISTGDEIVEIDSLPGPGQIRNSNAYALAALVTESGAELHSMTHVRDDERETEAALRKASEADVIVTSGGVSVGERDFVKPAIERLGTLDFWRVKMKPGKPIAVGRIDNSVFFGLPGNPVSTMVTFELFVRPAIRKLAGLPDLFRPRVRALLEEGLQRTPGREEYVRATVRFTDSGVFARPAAAQGSGALTSMLGANALLVVGPEVESLDAGESIDALLIQAG